MKRGQASFEYLMIMGFVTLIIVGILSIAVFYTGSVRGGVTYNQIQEFANKIISSSEYVFYAGEPSTAIVEVYLPENVANVSVQESSIVVEYFGSGGLSRTVFPSKVNISGSLPSSWGYKKIKILATSNGVVLSQA